MTAKTTTDTEPLMTMAEAIKALSTTRGTFNRWLRDGRIKGFKVGRQWRFRPGDITDFLRGREPRVGLPVGPGQLLEDLRAAADKAGGSLPSRDAGDPMQKAAEMILHTAYRQRASDIHIMGLILEGQRHGVVRVRIAGVLDELCRFDVRLLPALVERFKRMCRMDTRETRLPQDGRIEMDCDGKGLDFRLTTAPAVTGEAVAIRILDHRDLILDLDKMPFHADDMARIRHAIQQPCGLIVVSGPTGSGKTTTLYALLAAVTGPDRKIMSVEDPVEYSLPGTVQLSLDRKLGLTYPALLRLVMRSDPDVVLVGETADPETVEMTLNAALTGHLVLTSMHCRVNVEVLARLGEMQASPLQLADATLLVLCQRLLRRLCPHCCRPAVPDDADCQFIAAELARHGLGAESLEDAFAEPVGCAECNQMGYRGRTAAIETLAMSRTIERELLRGADAETLQRTAIAEGMTTMTLDGIRKAAAGHTSLREVRRVLGP